jgi:hypothetical protein
MRMGVAFDANGDPIHQYVTFYRVDPSAANGKGDWTIFKQQDYGPPPWRQRAKDGSSSTSLESD